MIMKRYEKQIDGKSVIKTLKEIVVKKDGKQTFNPSEEMVLADGWVEYVAPAPVEPSEEQLVERARRRKLQELHDYDEGKDVNNCVIVYQGQKINYWADKHERDSLKSAVKDCIALGRTEYRLDLREFGISMFISCELLLQMLSALEVYAIDCYNKTTDHLFAIQALDNIDAVEAYNYRKDYPSMLVFNI